MPTEPEELMLFGYPQSQVYLVGGVLVALLLLLLLTVLRRGKQQEPEVVEIAADDALDAPTEMVSPVSAKPAKPASAYLVFPDGKGRAAIYGDKVSVGRASSNDVVIEAESMSRLHAQIYRNRDGGYSVADMDSLNGTYVNDVAVSGTQKVQLGDTITFGKVTVKLVSA
ncbi:FHA domain-containing protein [Yoonia algicola]|uniref:FHA domain-containing protein n=1 Tax=Yoonia algicola TaxID=3137368 RepID=A0AAN0M2Y0_9RHOB